jgi:transcriptional regulator with XRE-family HTH domain
MAAKNLQAFGAYLRRLREQKGVSQARLVRDLNGAIGLRTIGRWETGAHEPYLSELAPVVAYLGGTIEDAAALITGSDPHQKAA